MARIRSIKPEFWTSEQVMECSPMARLLFVGMWNFCDDGGNHPASSKTLKAEVFPADDITSADIDRLVEELERNGLLFSYEAQDRKYWHVTGWHHQKIDQPTYRYPAHDGSIPDGAPKRMAKSRATSKEQGQGFADVTAKHPLGYGGVAPPESSRVESSRQESSKPYSEESVEITEPVLGVGNETPSTRKGIVCGLLRKAGMADAAPHHLTDETWNSILSKRTDEEIVEFARAKLASRPGKSTGLKYIAPGLLDDPEPTSRGSPRHASGKHADYLRQQGYIGDGNGSSSNIIDGQAKRVA